MIKVLSIVGTRPEAIKLAPVIHELERHPATFESKVIATGQHREMLDPMLDLFGIRPDYDLNVMRPSQTLTSVTKAVLAGLEPIFAEEQPDWVLVQGDTTTVMAASMAAFFQKIAVGHVEAGLRTFDKYSPYPEEINRRMAGVLADLHFAPTPWAFANLLREGVPGENIHMTGNTVIDSLHMVGDMDFDFADTPLATIPQDKRLVLVTAHRNENFGDGMEQIASGLRELALRHDDIHLVYPVHLNPRARQPAFRHLGGLDNVSLLDPLEYQPLVWMLHRAHLVITDSGGLQEEAAGVGTPVLVLRETTERPEGVEAGIAKLIGADKDAIVNEGTRLLRDEVEYERMSSVDCPYGDGRAAEYIVDALAGRRAARRAADSIYELPQPEHPLDAMLRHATAGIPSHYAEAVIAQARRARDRVAA
jgi:UDP-N-acetylglucosamine 2-epimerase (non-hydrolysing)